MPETAVHEQCKPHLPKNKIRTDGELMVFSSWLRVFAAPLPAINFQLRTINSCADQQMTAPAGNSMGAQQPGQRQLRGLVSARADEPHVHLTTLRSLRSATMVGQICDSAGLGSAAAPPYRDGVGDAAIPPDLKITVRRKPNAGTGNCSGGFLFPAGGGCGRRQASGVNGNEIWLPASLQRFCVQIIHPITSQRAAVMGTDIVSGILGASLRKNTTPTKMQPRPAIAQPSSSHRAFGRL